MKNKHIATGLLSLANVFFLLANVLGTDWIIGQAGRTWTFIMTGYGFLSLGFFFLYKTYKSK